MLTDLVFYWDRIIKVTRRIRKLNKLNTNKLICD